MRNYLLAFIFCSVYFVINQSGVFAMNSCMEKFGMSYPDKTGQCVCNPEYTWGEYDGKKYCVSANPEKSNYYTLQNIDGANSSYWADQGFGILYNPRMGGTYLAISYLTGTTTAGGQINTCNTMGRYLGKNIIIDNFGRYPNPGDIITLPETNQYCFITVVEDYTNKMKKKDQIRTPNSEIQTETIEPENEIISPFDKRGYDVEGIKKATEFRKSKLLKVSSKYKEGTTVAVYKIEGGGYGKKVGKAIVGKKGIIRYSVKSPGTYRFLKNSTQY